MRMNDTDSTPAEVSSAAPAPFDPTTPIKTTGPEPDGAEDDPDAEHPNAGQLIDPALPPLPPAHGPYTDTTSATASEETPLNAYGRTQADNDAIAAETAQDGD